MIRDARRALLDLLLVAGATGLIVGIQGGYPLATVIGGALLAAGLGGRL